MLADWRVRGIPGQEIHLPRAGFHVMPGSETCGRGEFVDHLLHVRRQLAGVGPGLNHRSPAICGGAQSPICFDFLCDAEGGLFLEGDAVFSETGLIFGIDADKLLYDQVPGVDICIPRPRLA